MNITQSLVVSETSFDPDIFQQKTTDFLLYIQVEQT